MAPADWALQLPGEPRNGGLENPPRRTLQFAMKPPATGFPQLERAPLQKSGSISRVAHLPQLECCGQSLALSPQLLCRVPSSSVPCGVG